MGVIIIDTLQRGGSGTSPFAVIEEQDSNISYVTVADLTARNSIEEWRRRSNMQCYVISTGLSYRLGTDLTISGQVWTEIPSTGSGFQLLSEKGQADGYVPLDSNTKIDASYINNIYSNNSFIAASEVAMLALSTQIGDIVTRTDTSQIFVKLNNNTPPTVIGDFAELLFPGAVLSVNGLTGAVSITITNLLAWGSNQTEFDAAVAANSTVSGNAGAITANQTNITTLQAEVLALQNATAQITDFDEDEDYVAEVSYVVWAVDTVLELYKCIQSTSNPSPEPDDVAFWTRIGDYYTIDQVDTLFATLDKLSAKGDILTHSGTANSRLAVGADGQVLTVDTSLSLGVKWADATGGGSGDSNPTLGDKALAPLASSGNESPTGIFLSTTPVGYTQVMVNGRQADLQGDKTGDCYFSNDGGTTARALVDIIAADQLIWNGVIAEFELLVSFSLSLNYNSSGSDNNPTYSDKFETPSASSGDESPTGITITSVPNGYTAVMVNGRQQNLRSDKLGDCYFSVDGGTTSRALNSIQAGDELIWNGVLAGFELLTSFRIDLNYNI